MARIANFEESTSALKFTHGSQWRLTVGQIVEDQNGKEIEIPIDTQVEIYSENPSLILTSRNAEEDKSLPIRVQIKYKDSILIIDSSDLVPLTRMN